MTASHILYRLSRCLYSERVRESDAWVTVSVPIDLWRSIMDKAGDFSQPKNRVSTESGKKE